jgi:hypothetical protein
MRFWDCRPTGRLCAAISKNRSSFALDQRLDTISTLLGIAAELHRQGVAHRDLAQPASG